MGEFEHTNTFINNPYFMYFDESGNAEDLRDQQGKILTREMVKSLIVYTKRFLKRYPTNDHIELKNMRIQREHDEQNTVYIKQRDAKRADAKENKDRRDIYLIKDIHRGCYKIGVAKDASIRLTQLKTANAGIELIKFFKGVVSDERDLHKHFMQQGKRIDGEWFSLGTSDIEHIELYFSNKTAINHG